MPDSSALFQLLRVYGDASTTFISRPSELRILHLLSSRYALGPKIHGTFTNGRLEEYFPSRALTANDLRDPETSRSIGKRMAELHSVDLDVLDPLESGATGREPTVLQSIKEWLGPARRMYGRLERLEAEGALGGLLAGWVQTFDLARLEREIEAYTSWLRQYERDQVEDEAGKAWRMVFCRELVLRSLVSPCERLTPPRPLQTTTPSTATCSCSTTRHRHRRRSTTRSSSSTLSTLRRTRTRTTSPTTFPSGRPTTTTRRDPTR